MIPTPGKLYRAKRNFYEFEVGQIYMVTKTSFPLSKYRPGAPARHRAEITFLKGMKEIQVPFITDRMPLEDWIESWIEEYYDA